MAITKSWEQSSVLRQAPKVAPPVERRIETRFLLAASFLVACGLALAFIGKTGQSFPGFSERVASGELLDLNTVGDASQIAPFLLNFTDPTERTLAAERVVEFLNTSRPLPNVGALARLRKSPNIPNRPLLPLAKLKPTLVVRTPSKYAQQFVLWILLYFASFWMVHLVWTWRRFRADPALLPALHLLTGLGLILSVSLRDPLRDTLDFRKFAWGVALGCTLLLLPLFRAFQHRHFSRWTYTPLLAGMLLFVLLLIAGSGPTGSDAKVNLGPFQPVEIIKVLLVLFLAGYFARRWEWLRELREKRLLPLWLRWPEIPRFAHLLPVVLGVTIALAIFFVLKDLGPALVTGFLFLAMFAVARGRAGLAFFGVALLVAGVALGYHFGKPTTVVDRMNMWLSPWDNNVRGGDQIAHSLWALSTGGAWGSGPGMGDPGMIPAGHTDLVLSSIGEEWGFPGVLTVFGLLALLVHRAFRIARHAPDEYAAFLAFGLGALIALEMLLISAGVLDAIPLSGVVSPFLSSGNTAMLANFFIFAMLAGISHQSVHVRKAQPALARPMRVAALVLASLACALVARAGYIQIFADRSLLIQDVHVFAEDGVKRAQHNPRLSSLMRQIPRGDIYDRNRVLLATSDWKLLEQNRERYKALGISIDQASSRLDRRHYPFGPATMYLLGDLRTGENFHATNSSLVEHDDNTHLQGYANLEELAPAVRYRHYSDHPLLRALRNRDRDVTTSIDIRLQMKVAEIARTRLQSLGSKGAIVVMETHTGDVLAIVNAPEPISGQPFTPDQLLDRARYGQYPPGSTFKLVTAMAALRKDPLSTRQTFTCSRLPDGRAGTMVRGWNRPIRDDIKDHPHGTLNMAKALTISCNAYFAQLGVFTVGSDAIRATAALLEIPTGGVKEFRQMLPFSSYGQGPVLTTPFKMARVAATIAAGGSMPQGRWILDASNSRHDAPRAILSPASAKFLADSMRAVVTSGTGRQAMVGLSIPIAGKTGTAQVEKGEPHSWFTGFAPYGDSASPQIAFAVVVEHGGYGSRAAAPIARDVIEAARDLAIIHTEKQ